MRELAPTRMAHDPDQLPECEWAIVPGARVRDDGTPSDALQDRLVGALALLDAGRVERVLVSGNNHSTPRGEVDVMVEWMGAQGVYDPVLVRDDRGFRTVDTMRHAAGELGISSAIICTQAFHLPRSIYLARAAGIDAHGLATHSHPEASGGHDAVREHVAQARALVDVELLGRARE